MSIQKISKEKLQGQETIYILDVWMASIIRKLTGQVTINHRHMLALESLGHTFERVHAPALSLTREKTPCLT